MQQRRGSAKKERAAARPADKEEAKKKKLTKEEQEELEEKELEEALKLQPKVISDRESAASVVEELGKDLVLQWRNLRIAYATRRRAVAMPVDSSLEIKNRKIALEAARDFVKKQTATKSLKKKMMMNLPHKRKNMVRK